MLNKRFSAILFGATILTTTFAVNAPSAQGLPWGQLGRRIPIPKHVPHPKVPPRKIPTVTKLQPYFQTGASAAGIAGGASTTYCNFNPCNGKGKD